MIDKLKQIVLQWFFYVMNLFTRIEPKVEEPVYEEVVEDVVESINGQAGDVVNHSPRFIVYHDKDGYCLFLAIMLGDLSYAFNLARKKIVFSGAGEYFLLPKTNGRVILVNEHYPDTFYTSTSSNHSEAGVFKSLFGKDTHTVFVELVNECEVVQ